MKKIFLVFLILLLIAGSFFVWQSIFWALEPGSELEKVFLVKRGEGIKEIASNLEKSDLIKSRFSFIFYLLLERKWQELKAGYYLLSPAMTVPEITERLTKGETIKEKITIIEGWSKKEIAPYLEEKGLCSREEFLRLGVEGFLFPDTYFIERESSCEQVVEQILANFEAKLSSELREAIRKQDKTIFEIVVMASLIEKEVADFKDRKLVSGILWKRLENGIPLQVDATITYVTGKKSIKISKEETQIDSPYNTYKYPGLPSGPIANPGLESIEAAIYPENSNYWYYLSTPEGNTIFSKTLEEHNVAKAKHLKGNE